MSKKSGYDYELDYVYMPESPLEFKSVKARLKILKDKIQLIVESKEPVAISDLSIIFEGLITHTFRRLNLNICADCDVFFVLDGKKYNVVFEPKTINVVELVEIK